MATALVFSFACATLYATTFYKVVPGLRETPLARRRARNTRPAAARPARISGASPIASEDAGIRSTSSPSMRPSLKEKLGPDRKFMRDAKGNMIEVSPEMDVVNTRQIQARMLRMIKLVDKICRENELVYWTCGGTLIGTLRHGGFIPFDADIDIAMPSESYTKFKSIAPDLLPPDLWLQDPDSDPRYPAHKRKEAKIRDLRSDYSDYSKEHKDMQNGIQLDIFVPFHECYRKTKSTCCKPLEDPLISPVRRHAFEGMQVNVPAEPEALLSAKYGNWDELPSVKNRISHQGHVEFVAPEWVKELYPKLYDRLETRD